jgi:hypothetical protein
LKSNEDVLGFNGRAARYLTKAANCQLAGNLDEANAVAISPHWLRAKDTVKLAANPVVSQFEISSHVIGPQG